MPRTANPSSDEQVVRSIPRGKQVGRVICCLLPLMAVSGCSDDAVRPTSPPEARLIVQASLTESGAGALVVEVTAPDLSAALIFNLPTAHGWAEGVISVPAGSNRQLTARAFDTRGLETHRGVRTIDVSSGVNEAVPLTLHPLAGEQPVVITVGSYAVEISPDPAPLEVGEQTTLQATVRDADGLVYPDAALQWASLGTGVAIVDAAGTVTALSSGTAQVVAVFAGAGASATVNVQ